MYRDKTIIYVTIIVYYKHNSVNNAETMFVMGLPHLLIYKCGDRIKPGSYSLI